MASVLAIRAGMKDAREGRPAFLWSVLTKEGNRRQLLLSGWKDISKLFMFRTFYPVQTLIVVVVVAVIPYTLVRGPAKRIASVFIKKKAQSASVPPTGQREK